MKKTGIIYGSSTGTCENIAQMIAEKLGVGSDDVMDVTKIDDSTASRYEALLLGSSTWGDGELQDDWYDGIETLKKADLSGKIIALFGCGDSDSYGDTFCDALGVLYDDLQDTGCTFVGQVDPSDYTYSESSAVRNGKFVGLPLDEMNENYKTEERISAWIDEIKKNL